MKGWKIVFLILGCVFLLFGLMGVLQMKLDEQGDTAYQVGYIIGSLVSFLPAVLFFFLAYRQNKKNKKKQLNKMTDSFLENE